MKTSAEMPDVRAGKAQTCGQGLAENSVLPAKLGELIDSLAENLTVHKETLDLSDENSRLEYKAYQKLSQEFREIGSQLKLAADEMGGYRDLPMGIHDQQELSGPKVRKSFEKFIQLEKELLTMIQNRLKKDQELLALMGRPG